MKLPRRRKRRSQLHDVGAPPGALTAVPDSRKPLVQVMAFGPEHYSEVEDVTDIETLPAYLNEWPVTWVNVFGLGDVELVQRFGELFELHPLALEDVLHVHQRSKVEDYEKHLFFVVRMIGANDGVETEQLSIFLGPNYVLTFQEHLGDSLDGVRKRIRQGLGRVRTMPADYLAYCLLDAVIDAYYPHLDEFSERIEAIEDVVMTYPTARTLGQIHEFKRDLLTVRRAMTPLRDAVASLLHSSQEERISKNTRIYLRDCYDHTVQILDLVENYREVVAGLLDIYLSTVNNRMNEIMKVLTIIATLFIPLSFLASVYGMNFDTQQSPFNMPELEWYFGYEYFWAVALAVVGLECLYFWRKGWFRSTTAMTLHDDDKDGPPKK